MTSQYTVVFLCCSFLLTLLCFGVDSPQAAVPSEIPSALTSFSTGCSGISAPSPGAHPPSPPSLTLISAWLFLTSFFLLLFLPTQHFSVSETSYHRGTNSLSEELSCVLWWICCIAGTGCTLHGTALASLHRGCSVAAPPTTWALTLHATSL